MTGREYGLTVETSPPQSPDNGQAGIEETMSDNTATFNGYTREVVASNAALDLFLLVQPDTDFDDTFRAWDTDAQEFIRVNGWLFSVQDTDAYWLNH